MFILHYPANLQDKNEKKTTFNIFTLGSNMFLFNFNVK